MLTRKYWILITCACGFLLLFFSALAHPDKNYALVVNAPIKAMLRAGETPLEIEGTLNLHLESSINNLKRGIVKVRGLNLAFSKVPQEVISGQPTTTKFASLGIPMHAPDDIKLNFDMERKIFSGTIPVQAYFPQIDEIIPPNPPDKNRQYDYSFSQTQEGNLTISIDAGPLIDVIAGKKNIDQIEAISLSSVDIDINPLIIEQETKVPGYKINLTDAQLSAQPADLQGTVVAKKFCVQPVSIRNDANDTNPTGRGLNFGRPAISKLWVDYGIAIEVKPDWIYIDAPDWKVADEGEAEKILERVAEKLRDAQIGNCIGVVFVENFSEVELNGGGWTIKGGTNQAKIITSDGNVDKNDTTHLAHELGHAFGLRHPKDTSSNLKESTAGTLMCPSGWGNRNPEKNSEDNINNIKGATFEVIAKPPAPEKPLCRPFDPFNRCGKCP